MSDTYFVPNELEMAIKKENVLLFVGAGVSKCAGLPLWKEIVEATLENKNIEKRIGYKSALDDGILSPLEVIDKLEEKNKKEVYQCFDEMTNKSVEHVIYSLLSKISKRIVTTNYDRLFEQNTKIPVIDPSSAYSLQKIDTADEFVLKIHGDCNAIDRAIIFSSDYKKLYENGDVLARFQLEKLISKYNCLFVGFSLSDPFINSLLGYLDSRYESLGPKHFVVASENIEHDFVENIKISSHSDLVSFVEYLIDIKKTNCSVERIVTEDFSLGPINSLLPQYEDVVIQIGHDAPPTTEYWSGRVEELNALMLPNKVCFVTGIGGQGKSALAARFILMANKNEYSIIDWRDFKEEDLNFQNKLFFLIEKVSSLRVKTTDLIGKETAELVDIFFECLGQKSGIFVFDNVDRYIDLETFVPTGDMELFYNAALRKQHKSKFIFTCRPFIHNASIGFYQVKLEGLKLDDVKLLLKKYNTKITVSYVDELALKLHRATNGHPLWLNIIIAQSRENLSQMEETLSSISTQYSSVSSLSQTSFIADTILKPLWNQLIERERIILRTLSISSIAEREIDLAEIVKDKLNYKNFRKALKQLKSFSLIVEKENEGYIELHPLVREYIKSNFAKEDQEGYISLYVSYLDGFMLLIKEKLGRFLSVDELTLISKKIDILITNEDFQGSVNELRTVRGSMIVSGWLEEYIRLADLLLSKIEWSLKSLSDIRGFDDFMYDVFNSIVEYGRTDIFEKYIVNFQKVFTGVDTRRILIKSSLCHSAWISKDFESAIKLGKSAVDLLDVLDVNEMWQARGRYYLSLRDSKVKENVEKALVYFMNGSSVDVLLKSDDFSISKASNYGNIGRCYQFIGDMDKALYFVIKSYMSLKDEQSYNNIHNLGYASLWLSELLAIQDKHADSLKFAIYARNIWKKDLPGEANRIDSDIASLHNSAVNESIVSLESWQIKKYCNEWVLGSFETIRSRLLLSDDD